ncbi:MLP-like protein, partial [Mya arenaria]
MQRINGQWAEWSSWGSCSLTCGDGVQSRHRTCTNPSPTNGGVMCPGEENESMACAKQACPTDGQWSLWSTWTNCSLYHDDGVVTRTRSCSNPSPVNGGNNCAGLDIERKSCQMPHQIIYSIVINIYITDDCSDVLKLGLSRGS